MNLKIKISIFCCIFAPSTSLSGSYSETKNKPGWGNPQGRPTFLTQSDLLTHPGFFYYLNFNIMSTSISNEVSQKFFEHLTKTYGAEFSPALVKNAIYDVSMAAIDGLYATKNLLDYDTATALTVLYEVYLAFSAVEKSTFSVNINSH